MDGSYKHWHHAPSHLFVPGSAYIVTTGTCHKRHLLDTAEKRDFLLQSLFEESVRWEWRLEAWAVLSNHYYIVAHAPENAETLAPMLKALHSKSAIWLNRMDGEPGRQVWFQYRDTCLTHQRSYLARLHYVHHNPAKHGVVGNAENYPWCSMAWFVQNADAGYRKTVLAQPIDRVQVPDDF